MESGTKAMQFRVPGSSRPRVTRAFAPDEMSRPGCVDGDSKVVTIGEAVAASPLVRRAGAEVREPDGSVPGRAAVGRPPMPGIPGFLAEVAIVLPDSPELARLPAAGHCREATVDGRGWVGDLLSCRPVLAVS